MVYNIRNENGFLFFSGTKEEVVAWFERQAGNTMGLFVDALGIPQEEFLSSSVILTEELEMLYDMCVTGTDHGSGNLETDEVELLRRLAVGFGVDPMEATPHLFGLQYKHKAKIPTGTHSFGRKYIHCEYCSQVESHEIHQEV